MTKRKLTIKTRQRAARCLKAITAYAQDDTSTTLVDFLADAMHFCDVTEIDFALALALAYRHYIHERGDEQPTERRLLP